jgi:hypothetical protein
VNRKIVLLALGVGLLVVPPGDVLACSICRCGDPTFNAFGPDVYTAGKFRLALDWDRFDKENGTSDLGTGSDLRLGTPPSRRFSPRAAGEITGSDAEVENRVTATLSYSFGESVTAVVRLPWSFRNLTSTDFGSGSSTTTVANGLSDPEIYALARLWVSGPWSEVGRRSWVSAVAGVKTNWGRNGLSEGGVRLDEHAQPGTGSTDVFAGLSAVYLVDRSSSLFGSAQYRSTGTNSYDYKYGNLTLANLAYERKFGKVVDGVLELNYRHSQMDRIAADGTTDPNTGGDILYLAPRVILDLGSGLVGRAGVQIPIVKSPYGDQTERVVVGAGMTYIF